MRDERWVSIMGGLAFAVALVGGGFWLDARNARAKARARWLDEHCRIVETGARTCRRCDAPPEGLRDWSPGALWCE